MKIILNGETREITGTTLAEMLADEGLGAAKVATAVNGDFVPAPARGATRLSEGDRVEILSPMQGG